ncbi:polysaccharide pyruvyl transferase family protein [Serratia sp. CY54039]|nr:MULTISPECIES: polysaccharide pyruvyl transferase family protein [Serratia]KAB5494284.1 polysaccharide pyruvyl transferase family protein [Enterobacter sp. RJAL6]MBH2599884.1 polysaccharide pyruvyl transferase family protein [Serratia ureilytica]MBH2990733.1 polysaccharide pyruvyl transferase family protein [Serratia ureilytica]MBH3173778.1 polysaccharide pyruvyl transferase family protein [Serratia ureilytica]MBN5398063.1 polysaccharide pyruvyl transferase family protein [Serratia ureilytic
MLNLSFSKNDKMRKRVFWWEPKDGIPNAGDHLAKVIVEQMLILQDKEIMDKKSSSNKLLSIGSVMHFANQGDCVWGTGVNGKIPLDKLNFSRLDVRAVRGPKTRKVLQDKGIDVPEVYGDPALLLPSIFSKKILEDARLQREVLVIPHMNEDMGKYEKYRHMLCSPRQGALNFTRRIVNSSFVISSSLHGVIIAEAYGIPAIFLDGESGESMFKYDDYYQGTGRDYYPVAKSVDEAFKLKHAEPIDMNSLVPKLFQAFPYDLWDVTES